MALSHHQRKRRSVLHRNQIRRQRQTLRARRLPSSRRPPHYPHHGRRRHREFRPTRRPRSPHGRLHHPRNRSHGGRHHQRHRHRWHDFQNPGGQDRCPLRHPTRHRSGKTTRYHQTRPQRRRNRHRLHSQRTPDGQPQALDRLLSSP